MQTEADQRQRPSRHLFLVIGLGLCAVAGAVAAARWGAFDSQPPQLAVRGMADGPWRGTIELELEATDAAPGLGRISYALDETEAQLLEGSSPFSIAIDGSALADGQHRLRVVASDRSLRRNRGELELSFRTDNTPPQLTISPQSLRGSQGRTLPLVLRTDEALTSAEVNLLGTTHTMYPLGDELWRALAGLAIRQEPGAHPAVFTATDLAGNQARRELNVQVDATDFPRGGFIRLTKAQRQEKADDEGRKRSRRERDAAYAHDEPRQLWQGPMLRPVAGRVSSAFGKYRSYSDGTRYHHTGLDLTTRKGTPVICAADGVVLLAHYQPVYGNVVIVHHGQGVSTSYNHLEASSVQVGQQLKAGEQVGLLGSTGQSTGPHLHWGLIVGGEASDPGPWMERGWGAEEFSGTP